MHDCTGNSHRCPGEVSQPQLRIAKVLPDEEPTVSLADELYEWRGTILDGAAVPMVDDARWLKHDAPATLPCAVT